MSDARPCQAHTDKKKTIGDNSGTISTKSSELETVQGELSLRDSPWDPIAELLPVRGPVTSELVTDGWLGREITLEGRLDPDAFWPFSDTIGGSRWPGQMGGPPRTR